MNIEIKVAKGYTVKILPGLVEKVGEELLSITKRGKVAIITDSNVAPLYLKTVTDSLTAKGFSVCSMIIAAGEQSKNGQTYLDILSFLAQSQITRADTLIALGGGVVGDIAGFSAATYLRGIAYVQMPTTLLAMVDSSVGGKTAIDLPQGKNLAGAFYQPALVLCDTDTLSTLPDNVLIDGCGEVAKYAMLKPDGLFDYLLSTGTAFDRERVISACVAIKGELVAIDENDKGVRQLLNLGHTVAHGIEKCSNYEMSHGSAVAIGMAVVARGSSALGICSVEVPLALEQLLNALNLPVTCPYAVNELLSSIAIDKKRVGDDINLIVPVAIGDCRIEHMPLSKAASIIAAGIEGAGQ